MDRLAFTVYQTTPSNNVWQRYHWGKRIRVNKTWHKEVHFLTVTSGWSHLDGRIKVDLTRHYKLEVGTKKKPAKNPDRKRLDRDNLYGGAKPCIDALVKCALIVDDDERFIELTIHQEPGTGTLWTDIVLERL